MGVENREIPELVSNSEERCCGSDFKSVIVTADGFSARKDPFELCKLLTAKRRRERKRRKVLGVPENRWLPSQFIRSSLDLMAAVQAHSYSLYELTLSNLKSSKPVIDPKIVGEQITMVVSAAKPILTGEYRIEEDKEEERERRTVMIATLF